MLIGRIDGLGEAGEYEVNWSGAVSDDAIKTVEASLGVRLPESYKAFARLVGGDGLDIFPISTIASGDDGDLGTLYNHTLYYREPWVPRALPKELVVIQRDIDDNEPFCFDTSKWNDGECPVVLYYLQSGHIDSIAVDFLTFYETYLKPSFDS